MQPTDPQGAYNPYMPPTPAGAPYAVAPDAGYGQQVLADRLTRLGAILLDGLLYFVCAIPGIVWMVVAMMAMKPAHGHAPATPDISGMFPAIGLMYGLMLPLAAYQWYRIAKTGQSLGKKWTGIKIVKVDGSPVDFVSGVVLRAWVSALIGFIPYLGGCVNLVGYLLIFGDQRRCLHDLIAGTKVVVA
jgi:uncharacterized RDD family membrane protein YckC